MSKNIAVFLDGTCDKYVPEANNNSNVVRLWQAALNDGERQVTFYSDGVGCNFHLGCAMSGFGVDERIARGYHHIRDSYVDGDAIYIFGFSRGAYEARSLAGMLDFVGLLKPDSAKSVDDAFDAYHHGNAAFKDDETIDVPIAFIGVWDTVGAIGIPIPATVATVCAPRFHRVDITPRTARAVHAMSIDEKRGDFTPTYFRRDPRVEQVYFAGVHCDVGGGYDDNCELANVTLSWMMKRAKASGLLLSSEERLEYDPGDAYGPQHDSYGLLYQARPVFQRVIDPGAPIHDSVRHRVENSAYAPINLDLKQQFTWIA